MGWLSLNVNKRVTIVEEAAWASELQAFRLVKGTP